MDRTIANIRALSPSVHANVPQGLAALAGRLEADPALFESFFYRLDLIFFAGAAAGPDLWRRLQALAGRARVRFGRPVALVSGYGATEAGSTITLVHRDVDGPCIGLPLPDLVMRLVPVAGKREARIKGPMVTPGYAGDPARTADAFDEDGFYRTGDAVRFVDDARPDLGLLFDGRIGDDFKLSSGTWVSVGALRQALLAALAPLVQDVVIAGHDGDRHGAILFPDVAACREALGTDLAGPALACHPKLIARLREGLAGYNAVHPTASTRIARAVVVPDPPDPARGEITDKGTLNQRACLAHRAALVQVLLHGAPPGLIDCLSQPQGNAP
jgi:feruloyl-CoA synthase